MCPTRPSARPFTDLADYRADKLGRARAIAAHPSHYSDHDDPDGDRGEGEHRSHTDDGADGDR